MIDRNDKLPIARQCQILELARSTAYYQAQFEASEVLSLMRRIDELHLKIPYAGARILSQLLKREGKLVGRKQVSTLMRRMGFALYRKPVPSRRHPARKVFHICCAIWKVFDPIMSMLRK
jgi:putative transposase